MRYRPAEWERLGSLLPIVAALTLFTSCNARMNDSDNVGSLTQVVRFTTEEGTWMNVDVSPDGKTILFDRFATYSEPRSVISRGRGAEESL
jgi:hypothetical protein